MNRKMKHRKTSLKDIAKIAGCSTTTVSNVLNSKGLFGDDIKQKVLTAVKKHNYALNASARNLRMGKTETIGVIFYRPNADIFKSEFYLSMMYNLQKDLFDAGYEILLSEYTDENARKNEIPRVVRNGRVDGIIVLGGFPAKAISLLSELNVPTIMLDTYSTKVDCIFADGAKAGFDTVKSLANLGHKRVAYFAYSAEDFNTEQRIKGFRKGIEDLKLDEKHSPLVRDFAINERACESFDRLFEIGKNLPTAIIASNDNLCSALMMHAQSKGYKVPQDISFFGHDDTLISTRSTPQLSTVRMDIPAMGKLAAKMIVDRIDNPSNPPSKKIFACELLLRASVSKV